MTLAISKDERGVITAMVAVLAIFLFLAVSVVAEGSRKLSNLSQAEDLAAEAARSAAATLDLDQIANGVVAIDLVDDRARSEARRVISSVPGAEMEAFVVDVDSVVVVVRVSGDSYLPGFSIDGVGRHRALAFDPFS